MMSLILRKNNDQDIRRTDSATHLLRITSAKGFTLIEMAVVMVIIGLIMVAGITFFRSSILSTKLSTTKAILDNVKNSVINFAMANGRLPCPATAPQGTSNPDPTPTQNPTVGFCINNACIAGNNCNCNCTAACVNFPCYVPFQTLQLQLPGGHDTFGNILRYDISHEIVAGSGLTNTTQDTFCGVLYEYMNHATDVPPPLAAPLPIVTNTNDPVDDGLIAAAGQGYGVAAIAISETPIDNVFNVPSPPAPALMGKNVAGSPREYEMANRPNSSAYGDLVAELTYNELYNKVCSAATQKTKIRIQNYTAAPKWVRPTGTTSCSQISPAVGGLCATPPCVTDLYQGSSIDFFNASCACQNPCTGCTTCAGCAGNTCASCTACLNCPPCSTFTGCTGCGGGSCASCNGPYTFTFNMSAVATDAGNVDWTGVAPAIGRDGRVQIITNATGACVLSDNTFTTP
jgi:prepilin-type N-terminal cleavage/methylation domain-containing protein